MNNSRAWMYFALIVLTLFLYMVSLCLQYEATEKLLLEQYPRKVRIVSRRDADVSGNFEITVNGYLAHSMRTKRHGFVHNNPSREKAVFAAIDVALEELHEKES